MAAGWNMDGEYVRLDESVEAPGGSAAQQRWARAGQQITGSLGVVRAMLGQSFEDFVSKTAARRLATGPSITTSARTSLDTEGGIAFGVLFVPEQDGSSSASGGPPSSGTMLLPIGSGNHQALLVDPSGQSPRRVVIEAMDEMIVGIMRLAPCRRRVCGSVGIDDRARLVMYQSDAETPWPILWAKTKGDILLDLDISADGSLVACITLNADCVDIHDAATGALCKTLPFGGCKVSAPQGCWGYVLRFSQELLVVKGGYGSTDEKAVGVWRLDILGGGKNEASAEPSQRLEYEYDAGPIAMCEKYLAVGALDGRISMHQVKEGIVQDWQIRVEEPREGSGQVMAVTFSHDGTMLAVAWAFGDVVVYDVGSTARTAAFHQDDCSGIIDMAVLTFSLDDARLVMGGACCATVSVHQVLPLRVRKFSILGGGNNNLGSAAVSTNCVALVDGTRVVVQRHSGEEMADIDCGEPIACNFMIAPVALRPTEEHVTVVLSSKSVVAYELQSSTLAWQHTGFDGFLCSIRYSPNGAFLITTSFGGGVHIFDADSGDAVQTFTQKPDYDMVGDAMFDPTSTKLFVGNYTADTPSFVVDVASGTKAHTFDQDASSKNGFGVFDEAGRRVAYDLTDQNGASSVVVSVLGKTNSRISILERVSGEDTCVAKGFSGDWLLLAQFQMDPKYTSDVALVRCACNYEVATELNKLLPMVLGGFTTHSSVGWVPGAATPTVHATVGSNLVFVDLEQFEAMTSDGCFSTTLLMDLCGDGTSSTIYQPEVIKAIVARFPHCVNIPKRTTEGDGSVGDTVLHYCARKHRTGAVELWLPLNGGVYTPVSSGEHSRMIEDQRHYFPDWTALHEAIVRNNTRMVEHLITTLTKTMNDVTATLISDAFALMVLMMPHFVPRVLSLLDVRLIRKEATIETHIHTQDEAFVSGRSRLYANDHEDTESGQTSGAPVVRMASMDVIQSDGLEQSKLNSKGVQWGTDPASGKSILPSEHPKSRSAQVDISVVQLKHILGHADKRVEGRQVSLFHSVVDRCDFAVYESIIMKAAVDYKWKQTRWWVMLDLSIYVVSLVVASFATVRLAWEASNPWEQTLSFPHGKATTEMIVLVMIVLELLLFVWECKQMVRANLL